MHAVLITVSIAPGQFEASRKGLREEVVPRVRKAPGLVKAYWTIRDDTAQGTALVIFDSKEQAESAAGMVRSSPTPPGATLTSVEVREVVADA